MMSRLLSRARVCNVFFSTIFWFEFLWNRAFSKRTESHTLMLLIYSVANFIAHETGKITARVQRNCITESFPKTYIWKSPQKVLSKTTKWWGVGMDITFNIIQLFCGSQLLISQRIILENHGSWLSEWSPCASNGKYYSPQSSRRDKVTLQVFNSWPSSGIFTEIN